MNFSARARWQRLRFLWWKFRNRRKLEAWSKVGAVLGLTTDVVFAEVSSLIRLRISKALNVDIEDVVCRVHYHRKKIVPEIQVRGDGVENLDASQIKEVISSTWRYVKPLLEERLKGLWSRR